MVKLDVVARKIATARARLNSAQEIFSRPRAEFLADQKGSDLASFYLFLAIQECIDLAAHWVADAGLRPPADYAETFDILKEHGVIEAQLAEAMRGAAGLRNRIAHGYAAIDHDRVYDEYAVGSAAVRDFLAVMADNAGL